MGTTQASTVALTTDFKDTMDCDGEYLAPKSSSGPSCKCAGQLRGAERDGQPFSHTCTAVEWVRMSCIKRRHWPSCISWHRNSKVEKPQASLSKDFLGI